ncbi:MAG TPA: hypothetical protein VHB70_03365 [Parafilimonas sp.]|nr:hypothetical protein [Parafilimonas sp.]
MAANLIFIHGSYSWETTFGLAIVCFVLGFIFRSGLIYKQRKKILSLEDEMVNNHARILALEKKLNESKPDNQHPDLEVVSNKAS